MQSLALMKWTPTGLLHVNALTEKRFTHAHARGASKVWQADPKETPLILTDRINPAFKLNQIDYDQPSLTSWFFCCLMLSRARACEVFDFPPVGSEWVWAAFPPIANLFQPLLKAFAGKRIQVQQLPGGATMKDLRDVA